MLFLVYFLLLFLSWYIQLTASAVYFWALFHFYGGYSGHRTGHRPLEELG